jgi:hypothetical protein
MSTSMLVSDNEKTPMVRAWKNIDSKEVWLLTTPETTPSDWVLKERYKSNDYTIEIYDNEYNQFAIKICP